MTTAVTERARGGMTAQESRAFDRLKAFYNNLMKKLTPPLLCELLASSLRAEVEHFAPKRMTRAAKRSANVSAAKPKSAENVLLRALGLVPDDLVADEAAVQELQSLFDSPLCE